MSLDWALLLQGLRTTGSLLVLTGGCGLVLAVLIAAMRLARSRLLAWPARAYAALFRGTPLLAQIYLIYYGLPQFAAVRHAFIWPLLRHAYPCAAIALSLNMAAYVSEVFRAGFLAVPRGEREAAAALGLSRWQGFRFVVLPRAVRLVLPALGNEMVVQMKATSLASTITLVDLTGAARRMTAATYSMVPLLVAGVLYALLAWAIGRLFRALEQRSQGGMAK
jgi:polar amino acid transport system permease protein